MGPFVRIPRAHRPAEVSHQPHRSCFSRHASNAAKSANVTHRASTVSRISKRPHCMKPGDKTSTSAARNADLKPRCRLPKVYTDRIVISAANAGMYRAEVSLTPKLAKLAVVSQ